MGDLDHHLWLIGSSPFWHFSEAGEYRLYRPRPIWRCNNRQAVLDVALKDMGICQLPHFYLGDALQSGRILPRLEQLATLGEPIWAVYPDKRHLSPNVQRIIAVLREESPIV